MGHNKKAGHIWWCNLFDFLESIMEGAKFHHLKHGQKWKVIEFVMNAQKFMLQWEQANEIFQLLKIILREMF